MAALSAARRANDHAGAAFSAARKGKSGRAGLASALPNESLFACLQRGTFDPALPVSAWVFAIARHKLVDLCGDAAGAKRCTSR